MLKKMPNTQTTKGSLPFVRGILPGEVQGLNFKIGERNLINNIDLTLSFGKVTVIMGPNGAGKSLLLRLLHGLIKPTSGTILWGNCPLCDRIRRHQAMVFQKPVLLRRSVAANIDFVLKLRGKEREKKRQEILQLVQLLKHINQPARMLSAGEQQRLALARALVLEPEVLFLDEPTANLDPASVGLIESIVLNAHNKGTKIVFVTHDLGQAKRIADEVIFINHGSICEHTPAKEFFKSPRSQEAQYYISGRLVY